MPFTLVHAGRYVTEDKLKIQTIHKLNTTQEKQTMQNTAKLSYPGLVGFYDTRPENEVGLFYDTHTGLSFNQFVWSITVDVFTTDVVSYLVQNKKITIGFELTT